MKPFPKIGFKQVFLLKQNLGGTCDFPEWHSENIDYYKNDW